MAFDLSQILDLPVIAGIRRLPIAQKVGLVVGVVAVSAAMIAVSRWASAPEYRVLYNGLDFAETAQITAKLDEASIPYRIEGNGTRLAVPADQAAKAQMKLSEANLPQSGKPGLELFDKPSWGATDFDQRVHYRRALEGELERSIKEFDGVRSAQVHVTLGERSAFARNDRNPTASVVVTLADGHDLSSEAIAGITHLVAGAVDGLKSDDVALMDTRGRMLSVPEDGSPAGAANRQLELQRAVEQHYAEKVKALLAGVVGDGNARVEVSARLNFDRVRRESENYDPDRQVVLSEQQSNDNGAVTPPSTTATAANSKTTNYQNARSVESVESAIGSLSRLYVSVLVNSTAGASTAGAKKAVRKGPTAQDIARMNDLVRSAVGYDSTRGDRVVVESLPFEAPAAVAGAPETPAWQGYIRDYWRPAIGVVGMLLLLLIAFRFAGSLRAVGARPVVTTESASAPRAPQQQAEPEDEPIMPIPLTMLDRTAERAVKSPDQTIRVIKSLMAE